MTERVLYSYFRSSAAYRVRIALTIKELDYQQQPVSLARGEQQAPAFAAVNPQRMLPVLKDRGVLLTQSLAICEYLDETYPNNTPPLLPLEPIARARARAIAQLVACDIHPINNLRVLSYLMTTLAVDDEQKQSWYCHWVHEGFMAVERMLKELSGEYALGDQITIADIFLVPQVFNALRFNVDLAAYPTLLRVTSTADQHPAFIAAHPMQQTDAL